MVDLFMAGNFTRTTHLKSGALSLARNTAKRVKGTPLRR